MNERDDEPDGKGMGEDMWQESNLTHNKKTHRLDHHGGKLPQVGSQTGRGRGGPRDESVHVILVCRRGADGLRKQQNRQARGEVLSSSSFLLGACAGCVGGWCGGKE